MAYLIMALAQGTGIPPGGVSTADNSARTSFPMEQEVADRMTKLLDKFRANR